MTKLQRFILLLALMMTLPMNAKKAKPSAGLSVEQEQQFTYYWYAAKQAINREEYDKALVLLEFCNMIKPDDAQTLGYLGVIYRGIGQTDRAKATFKRAYELNPKDQWLNYLEPLKQDYIKEQKWAKALKVQDEIDSYKEYDGFSAATRFQLNLQLGKTKKALQAIDKYLESEPTDLRFWAYKLQLLERMNAKPKVLYAAYDKVLELEPGNAYVLNNYAYHMATNGGDLQKAEQMSAMTIKAEPSNPVYLDTYGWILHLRGKDDLAKIYLERALWNAGNDANVEKVIKEHLRALK